MKINVKDVGPCKKHLTISIGLDQVKAEIEEHMAGLVAHVQLPGFRPGKAPRALVEKRFGPRAIEEARDHLIAHSWDEAVKEQKLQPFSEPSLDKVDFDPAKGLTYEATVEVRPEFDLPALQNIPLSKKAVKVTEADLDAALADLCKQNMQWDPAAAGYALAKGDLAVCDLSLLDGDKKVWEQAGAGVVLDGENLGELPTGPTEKFLEGYKASETAQVVATLPEDFTHAELRGKMATIRAVVKEVRRPRLPEADEAFAKQMGFDSVPLLREGMKSHVQRHKEGEAHRKLEEDLVSWLIEKTKFELPADVLAAHAEDALRRTTMDLLMRGIPEKQVRENLEKLKTGTKEGAERRLRTMLILAKVSEKEKILVTESDVEDRIRQMAASYGERPEAIRQKLDKEGGMPNLRAAIRESKAIDLLLKRTTGASASEGK